MIQASCVVGVVMCVFVCCTAVCTYTVYLSLALLLPHFIFTQVNASVQVDASQPEGLLITNGEFTSFIASQFGPEVRGREETYQTVSNGTL